MAVALNVGDYLLGEGYRLLADVDAPAERPARDAARRRRKASANSAGARAPSCAGRAIRKPLTSLEVLDIFRQKTAPAFEVALRSGALFAGADDEVHDVLGAYSEALGIAYQIRDDLDDLAADQPDGQAPDDLPALRPSLPLAVGLERAKAQDEAAYALLQALWRRARQRRRRRAACARVSSTLGVDERCRAPARSYKEEADPLARRARERQPQGPAAPRGRQDLQRHRDQGLVQ